MRLRHCRPALLSQIVLASALSMLPQEHASAQAPAHEEPAPPAAVAAPQVTSIAPKALLIVLALRPDDLDLYRQLDSPAVRVVFRNPGYGASDPLVDRWERQGVPYYVTVSSSDFPRYQERSLYAAASEVESLLSRPNVEGIYLHEVVTYLASQNGWRWDQAVQGIDWGWLETTVSAAQARGKRVVWSEPAHGWASIAADPRGQALLEHAGATMVATFATNFDTPAAGRLMQQAATDVEAAARRYGLAIGQSHQSWHFRDESADPTRDTSFDLAVFGWSRGARIFQVEGTVDDLAYDSAYMLGVRDFLAAPQSPLVRTP